MAVELAAGYATLTVKTAGVSKGLSGLFEGAQRQATGAGKKAGESYLRGLESELKTAEAQSKKFAEAQSKARDKEAEAAGRLRVATEKLNEAKRKGLADGGRLAQLEEAQASATRRHASAASELARQTDAAARAQKRQARAQQELDSAPTSEPKSGFLSRLRQRFSADGAESGRAFRESAASEVESGGLASAAANAGQKVKGGFLAGLGRAAALAAPFVGVGAIISKGWGRMVALDNAQAKMRQLGVEGQRLEDVMGLINKSVKGTSFGLGDAATVASQALAAGVKEGADLAQHMQTIVDAAAYGQVPLEEMGTIMNRAKISGKVLSEDLNMLGDRGTPVYAWLAEDLGMAGDELAKFVSDGKLRYEDLNATLQKHSQGAGQRSGETFMGALSNLGAAAGRLGEKILQPIFKPLQQGVVWMTEAFGKISPQVESMVGGIAESVGGFVTGKLLPAFRELWPTIQSTAKSLYEGFQAALPTIKSVTQSIAGGFGDAIGFVVRFKDFLIPLVAGLVAYKGAVMVINGVTKAWAAVQGLLNIALTANPVGIVVAAIAALIAGMVMAYKKCETFRNIVNAAWSGIKTVISAVWGWIKTYLFPIWKAEFKAIGAVVSWLWNSAVKPAWSAIQTGIKVGWAVIKVVFNAWKKEWQLIGKGAMWLWNNAISPAWNGIKTAFGVAWDFVGGIIDKFVAGWEVLKTGVTGAATAIKTGITSAFRGLANIIKAPLRALGGFLANIPDTVLGISIPGAGTLKSWGQSLQGLAGGGVVRGPGTGTSDSVLAWLSNGEGVVTARAMGNGGGAVVAALNAGWTPSADYLRAMFMGIPGHAEGLNPGADYLRSMVMKLWPQISSIGGRRGEDGYGEHSSGNALDIMIPNYGSPEGVSLGNSVLAFLQKNGSALDVNGIIWRRTSYGYGGSLASGKDYGEHGNDTQNHMDHLHVILGKGRGAGAAPVSVPTMRLSAPSGSLGSGTLGGGGQKSAAIQSKIATKQTRLGQLNADLAAAEQALAEAEANPKTKESTLMNKRNSVQKKKDAIAKAQSELDDLNNQLSMVGDDPGASGATGKSSGNDPFSKIIDGFSELGQAAMDGAVEGLLPPGFSNPFEWGILKAGGGLMKWIGGLTGDPVANAVLGTIGSGMTGDVQGAGSAIAGLFNPQQMLSGVAGDDMGGAFTDGMIDPGAGVPGGGATVDNSVTVNNAPYQDSTQKVMDAAAGRQMAGQRRYMGTQRIV